MPRTEQTSLIFDDVKAVIFSCSGLVLTDEERTFFKKENPFGFILFARNVETPDQVRSLISDFREAVGRDDAPVLVDQEGGRVQRLRSPHWFDAPSFGTIGKLYQIDPSKAQRALRLATQLIAMDLMDLGFTVDCTPCLDLGLPETSNVIGDRSFADDPELVAEFGEIVIQEMVQAGITPVIKHMPGHGRGTVDSHHELPVVKTPRSELSKSDFVPFKKLSSSPWGMTAHIVYDDIDAKWPATQSATVIKDVIRGEIGFDGLLLTDDLNMQALDGELDVRAARALNAGIDVILHCSGKIDEMKLVAGACDTLSKEAIRRIENADRNLHIKSAMQENRPENRNDLIAELGDLLKLIEVE